MTTPMTTLARTRADLLHALAGRMGRIGVVLTMGALHDGHVSLIRHARRDCDVVVVTVFVNPLQFGPNEDLARYPRPLDDDIALCQSEEVDIVFAPSVDEVYPDGEPRITVDPGPIADQLEGSSRPGHFRGVLTVVCKLLHLVHGAEVTYFGEKDYQQVALVRRMIHDLELGVDVVVVPTVREPDGLARSSRNRYLSPPERQTAVAISRALRAAADSPDDPLGAARKVLAAEPGLDLDYVELRAPDLGPPPTTGEARLLIAARVGTTRLIDNAAVHITQREREERL